MKALHIFMLLCCAALLLISCGGGSAGTSLQHSKQPAIHYTLAELTAQVEAQTAPAGVDAKVFAELKAALIEQLTLKYPSGASEQVPDGRFGYVDALVFETVEGVIRLAWDYYNYGDYSRNGVADGADLVEISQYYLATPASPDWSEAQTADGDANNEVNSADITPISENYQGLVAGYNVYGAASPDGPWTKLGAVGLPEGVKANARIRFSYPVSDDYPYYCVHPYDLQDTEGIQSVVSGAAPLDTEWSHTWGSGSQDTLAGLAVDSSGNIFATGFSGTTGSTLGDVQTATLIAMKVSPQGKPLWEKQYTVGACAYGQACALDSSGNLWIAGVVRNAGEQDNVLILKLSPTGALLSQQSWGGSRVDRATSITVGPDHAVYVCGIAYAEGTGAIESLDTTGNAFVVKLNPTGSQAWATLYGKHAALEVPRALAVHSDGTVHIAGIAGEVGAVDYRGSYTVFNSDGSFAKQLIINEISSFSCLSLDAQGNAVLGGKASVQRDNFSWDACVCRFDAAGGLAWCAMLGGAGDEGLAGLRAASDGGYYAAGWECPDLARSAPVLFKLNATGQLMGQEEWGPASNDRDCPAACALTVKGQVLMAGCAAAVGGDTAAASSFEALYCGAQQTERTPDTTPVSDQPVALSGSIAAVELTQDTGAGQRDGWIKKAVPLAPSTNQPPVPALQVTLGANGLVEFDASAAADPDGTIANIEWNLDYITSASQDNAFNEDGAEAEAEGQATASFTYAEAATCRVQVRFTDNAGAVSLYTSAPFIPTGPKYISGYVYGVDEVSPVAGVEVHTQTMLSAITNADGYYSIEVADDDIYFISASYDGYAVVPATQGVTVSGASVYVPPFHLAQSGAITLEGSALYHTREYLGLSGVQITARFDGAPSDGGLALTDSDGNWTMTFDYDQPENNALLHITAVKDGITFYLATQDLLVDYTQTMPLAVPAFIAGSIQGQPIAVLTAPSAAGDPPLTQEYSLAGSTDSDGTIVEYLFDFGAGWVSNGNDPTQSYTFTNPGVFTVWGRVVDDGGWISDDSFEVNVAGGIPTGLAADTLYVYPMADTAAVDEPVTVLVLTGPTTAPLKYVTSVVVSMATEGSYVNYSFNPGAPGGGQTGIDGIWTYSAPTGFILPSDFMISLSRNEFVAGRVAYNLNLTPAEGVAVTGEEGVLLNFQVAFSAPGTYRLGIRDEYDGMQNLTYFSDAVSDHEWLALSADKAGNLLLPAVPNVITVH
jgi:hypothetical protein